MEHSSSVRGGRIGDDGEKAMVCSLWDVRCAGDVVGMSLSVPRPCQEGLTQQRNLKCIKMIE